MQDEPGVVTDYASLLRAQTEYKVDPPKVQLKAILNPYLGDDTADERRSAVLVGPHAAESSKAPEVSHSECSRWLRLMHTQRRKG